MGKLNTSLTHIEDRIKELQQSKLFGVFEDFMGVCSSSKVFDTTVNTDFEVGKELDLEDISQNISLKQFIDDNQIPMDDPSMRSMLEMMIPSYKKEVDIICDQNEKSLEMVDDYESLFGKLGITHSRKFIHSKKRHINYKFLVLLGYQKAKIYDYMLEARKNLGISKPCKSPSNLKRLKEDDSDNEEEELYSESEDEEEISRRSRTLKKQRLSKDGSSSKIVVKPEVKGRRILSKAQYKTLEEWFTKHQTDPFPDEHQKPILAMRSVQSFNQLENWLSNKRIRVKKLNIARGKGKLTTKSRSKKRN